MTITKTNFSFWTNFAERRYAKNRLNNTDSVSCLKSLIKAHLGNVLQQSGGKATGDISLQIRQS